MRKQQPKHDLPVPDTDDIEIVSVDAVDADGQPIAENTHELIEIKIEQREDDDEDDAIDVTVDMDADHAAMEMETVRERLRLARTDLENYRARVERDRKRMEMQASEGVIAELLPVLDDLDRGLRASAGAEVLREGLEMIARSFRERLARFGLKAVEVEGVPFDPEVHEAAAAEVTDAVPAQTILGELRRGYLLGDRLLRPALVRVAVPSEEEPKP